MRQNIRTLQVFECLYRHGSIAKAADELAITQSAVSHQLRSLRMQIGEGLIERAGQNLSFTPRGVKLAQSLSDAFAEIDSSVSRSIDSSTGGLRVAVCSAFGTGWLIPRLKLFPQATECRLQVKLHAMQPELTGSVADIFFTTKPAKDGFWTLKLLSEELVPVESARHVFNEKNRRCLITTDVEDRRFMEEWKFFLASIGQLDLLESSAVLGASHYVFAAQMAMEGLGIALVPNFYLDMNPWRDHLRDWHSKRYVTGRSYYLSIKQARRNEDEIRSFVKWVRRMIADTPIE